MAAGLSLISVGTLARTAIGDLEWIRSRPTTRPLHSVAGPLQGLPTDLLNKQELSAAIGDRIVRAASTQFAHQFKTLSFEQAGEDNVDALLTVRVQSVGLVADSGDDPQATLRVQAWVNFARTTSRPIVHTSRAHRLNLWAVDDARLLQTEVDLAADAIADDVMTYLFPVSRSGGMSSAASDFSAEISGRSK